MAEWTEELKQEVIEQYLERNPTPENTTDIVLELADEFEKTPNGLRRILVSAGVYISKGQPTTSGATKAKDSKEPSKRVSKADSIAELTELLNFGGLPVDGEILDKLTGKAAIYFTSVVKKALEPK